MIRNIVFDFGGVLIDWNPRYLYRSVFSDEAEMERFLAEVCSPEWNMALDAGLPYAQGVHERQQMFPQYAEQLGMYDTRWIETVRGDIPGTVALLEQLQQLNYPVYGLTNWASEKFALVYNQYPFFKTLKGIVVSGDEGMVKPNPHIYRILFERYSLNPAETVFIDDNPVNVQASIELGMHAIRFISPEQTKAELASLLKIELK